MRRNRRPKGRGSNYEKKKFCQRCRKRTTHLFDHGEGMHICQNCDF